MVETTKWQVKSNGLNFIVLDPEDDFRTVAECARKEDAETICALRERISWRTDALRDAHRSKGDLFAKVHDLSKQKADIQSLAQTAKELCEWTRLELTGLIDKLDVKVRQLK